MTQQDLVEIKRCIGDLRFIQAAAIVGCRLNESKQAMDYMKNLNRLESVVEQAIKEKI